MYDPLTPWIVQDYQNALLEQAEQDRVVRAARAASPRFWVRLALRVGDVLIALGIKLQQRYQPVTFGSDPETCRAGLLRNG